MQKKSFLSIFVLAIAFTLFLAPPAQAADSTGPVMNDELVDYVGCPGGGGRHAMHPCGIGACFPGTMTNPGAVIFVGTLSQCSKCGIYMISQSYPGRLVNGLGMYSTGNTLAYINGYSAMWGGIEGTCPVLPGDQYIQGFEFFLS